MRSRRWLEKCLECLFALREISIPFAEPQFYHFPSVSPRLYKPIPESSTPEILLPIPSDSETWEFVHLWSRWHSALFQNSKDHTTHQLFPSLLFLLMRRKCTHPQAKFHVLSSTDQHPTIQRSDLFQKDPVGSQDARDRRTPIEHTGRELLTSY